MPPALARIHDDFALPGQDLLQCLQVKPRLIRTGSRAEGLLGLDELAGVAL